MNLEDLRLFAAVARYNSYAKAAEKTGVARSTLSRVIQRLEASAGLPLLHRTTRKVGLTKAGATLLERIRPGLDDLEQAARELKHQKGEPSGLVRITTTNDLAVGVLTPVVVQLMQKYPHLRVETFLTIRSIDLMEERMDLALRTYPGPPTDSSLRGRRLMSLAFGWYAAPSYLAQYGNPQTEQDLAAHTTISIGRLHPHARMLVDDPFFNLALTKAGAGVGFLAQSLCKEAVDKGELVRLLPDVSIFEGQVWLLYPSKIVSPATAVLRDAIIEQVSGWKGS